MADDALLAKHLISNLFAGRQPHEPRSAACNRPGVHVAVIAHPSSGLTVANEIRLAKAALLYADHVTLVSPTAAMLALLSDVAALPPRELEKVVDGLVMGMMDPSVLEAYKELGRLRRKSPAQLLLWRQISEQLSRTTAEMRDVLTSQVQSSGAYDLAPAVAAGLLDIDTLGLGNGGSTEEVTSRFMQVLLESVAPDTSTFPLIDDGSGDIVRAFQREIGLQGRPGREAEEASLAAFMVETIAAFPDASVEEIVDARRDLAGPLVRFRSAMAEMSRDLSVAPWDPGFKNEASAMYRSRVAPELAALADLSEQLRVGHSLRRTLASRAPAAATVAGLGLAISSVATLPSTLLPPMALVSAGVSVSTFAAQLYKERRDVEAARIENKMLFLFEADRTLTR